MNGLNKRNNLQKHSFNFELRNHSPYIFFIGFISQQTFLNPLSQLEIEPLNICTELLLG